MKPTHTKTVESVKPLASELPDELELSVCQHFMHDEKGNYLGVLRFIPENVAKDMLRALQLMTAHYDDLCKSNPGFMGKLCLQNYALWNEALLAMDKAIARATGGGERDKTIITLVWKSHDGWANSVALFNNGQPDNAAELACRKRCELWYRSARTQRNAEAMLRKKIALAREVFGECSVMEQGSDAAKAYFKRHRKAARPSDCECDNTHDQNKTCCTPCWNAGFRSVAGKEGV